MSIAHPLPSGPLPPPPRRVRLRPRAVARVWLGRLVTVPFILSAAGLISLVLADPITRSAGEVSTGRVTEVHRAAQDAQGHEYDVTFTYDAGHGRTGVGHGRLDTVGFSAPVTDQRVPLVLPPPLPFCRPLLLDQDGNLGGLMCGGAFAVVWTVAVALLTTVAWVGPALGARRVRDGVAVVGVVTDKRQVKVGRSVHHQVDYRYASADGAGRAVTAIVPAWLFAGIEPGQAVTLLYPPSHPDQPMLYEACDHQAVPA